MSETQIYLKFHNECGQFSQYSYCKGMKKQEQIKLIGTGMLHLLIPGYKKTFRFLEISLATIQKE